MAAVASSVVLLGLRLDLSRTLGLGDAEALFFAYGFHPQPAYLDQPGLIGWLARCLRPDASPGLVHLCTSVAATALPWFGVLAARACGARGRAALRSYFPLALLPELSLGVAGFTPDLPFAFCWLGALGCAGWALRHPPAAFRTLLASLGAGAAAALCCLSRCGGWLLVLGLAWVCLERAQAARRRTLAPWAALIVFGILVAPLVRWWLTHGINLRLNAELSWQSVSVALFRPLVAATPPFLFAGALVARDLLVNERRTPIDRLLLFNLVLPLGPLLLLAISVDNEGGWLTPAYLALSLQVARSGPLPSGLIKSCIALGASIALLGWCWLRTDLPFFTGQLLGGYEPTWDTTSDLYAWGPGRQLLQSVVAGARERTGSAPLVVGPHWAVCAQAEVALAGRTSVGCDSTELDDYDRWSNAASWADAETIVFVTDSRFNDVPPQVLYGRPALAVHETVIERFGRSVRHISVSEFDREEANAQLPKKALPRDRLLEAQLLGDDCTDRPARAKRARSSASSGLGVVSSFSP